MRPTIIRFTIATLVVSAWLVPASAPAFASVTAEVVDSALFVTGDAAANTIVIECTGGHIKVNRSDPGTGPHVCRDLVSVSVRSGQGADRVDLSGLGNAGSGSFIAGQVESGPGDDLVIGSEFGDVLYGQSGFDVLRGGGYLDELWPGEDGGRVLGGGGSDTLRLHGGGNWVVSDRMASRHVPAALTIRMKQIEEVRIYGTAASDRLDTRRFHGTAYLHGRLGADILRTGRGDDYANGGGGPDTLSGGSGDDQLNGKLGRDILKGRRGRDTLRGGSQADACRGGPGQDSLHGCE